VEQALDARHMGGHEISAKKNTKLIIGAMRILQNSVEYCEVAILPA
jgi:hypothetical protein